MIPVLTKRLLLLPCNGATTTHVKQIVSWLTNPDIMQFSEQRHRIHNEHTQRLYMDSILPPSTYQLIFCGPDLIGTMTSFVDRHNGVADMGILIGDKERWGQGFGFEAWQAQMNSLFHRGIRKIEAGCMDRNIGMIHLFVKSGMQREGQRHLHFDLGGHDYAGMELWGKFNG